MRVNTRWRQFAALMILAAAPAAYAQTPAGWNDISAKSFQLIGAGKAAEAVAPLEKVVAANPSFVEAHELLAAAHETIADSLKQDGVPLKGARTRHLETAALHYRRVLDLRGTGEILTHLSLAEIYGPGGLNHPAEAEKMARLVINDSAQMWEAHALLAWSLFETQRANAAAVALRQGRVGIAPEKRLHFGAALSDLAKEPASSLNTARALLSEAVAIADEAIAAQPPNGEAYMFKAVVVEIQASREQDPARKTALIAEGRGLWEKGRSVNAAARGGQNPPSPALPSIPQGYYEDSSKARDLAIAGKHGDALAIYERYVKSHPQFGEAHAALASTHQAMGDAVTGTSATATAARARHFEAAVTHYRRAAELANDPGPMPVQLALAIELYRPDRLNRPADAETLARHLVDRYPADPASHTILLQLLLASARRAEAATALAAANKAVPTTPAERHALGVYLYDLVYRDKALTGDDARAIVVVAEDALGQALKANPDSMESLVYKSLVLRLRAARFEPNPERAKALVAEADRLRDRAMALRNKK
jgi:hypothetical protein